jgi:3-deoxy-7-phosphoheptulonate synthase
MMYWKAEEDWGDPDDGKGGMIESFIKEGKQKIYENEYGKSVVDGCFRWNDTGALLRYIAESV